MRILAEPKGTKTFNMMMIIIARGHDDWMSVSSEFAFHVVRVGGEWIWLSGVISCPGRWLLNFEWVIEIAFPRDPRPRLLCAAPMGRLAVEARHRIWIFGSVHES